MDLQKFIQTALSDICFGIIEAKYNSRKVMSIAPGKIKGEFNPLTTEVKFDIVVSVKDQNEKSKNFGGNFQPIIEVIGASIGGNLFANIWHSNNNEKLQKQRLEFTVPIILNTHHLNDRAGDAEMDEIKPFIDKYKEMKISEEQN